MLTVIFAVVVALSAAPPLRGTVVDPDARSIAGARVELTCGRSTRVTTSDAHGDFTFSSSQPIPCVVRVTTPGFEISEKALDQWPDAVIRIQLALSPHQERVDVRSTSIGPAFAASGLGPGGAESVTILRIAGPDLNRWLAIASVAAGAPPGAASVRVNGLAGPLTPSTGIIRAVRASPDPWSVETSGDQRSIDIETELPDQWQFSVSPGVLKAGARDVLASDASHSSQTRNASAGGLISPRGRWRMFSAASSTTTMDRPTYVERSNSREYLTTGPTSGTTSQGWSASTAVTVGSIDLDAAFAGAGSSANNAGLGGSNGPSAALTLTNRSRQFQTTLRATRPGWILTAGVLASTSMSTSTSTSAAELVAATDAGSAAANPTSGVARIFAGQLLSGAPALVGFDQHNRTWSARAVLSSTHGAPAAWVMGVEAGSDRGEQTRIANPAGALIVTNPLAIDGTAISWTSASTSASDTRMSLFAQRTFIDTSRVWLRAGVRADRENVLGLTIAPRAALGFKLGRNIVAFNAGTFTAGWPTSSELERQFRLAPETLVTAAGQRFVATLSGIPVARVNAVAHAAIVRPFAHATIVVEETATRGRHLAGLLRQNTGDRFIDVLQSNRHLTAFETRARVDALARGWSMSARYSYNHSFDNSDGAFAWPASSNQPDAEWAPSSGVPRHTLTLVTTGRIARGTHGINALITARFASGAPYSLVTGQDDGLLTFAGRADRQRNAERLPATRDVSAYVSWHLSLPVRGLAADAGVRLENLLASVSALAVDRVATSTLAGQAILAAPGRSISVWMTIGRR